MFQKAGKFDTVAATLLIYARSVLVCAKSDPPRPATPVIAGFARMMDDPSVVAFLHCLELRLDVS